MALVLFRAMCWGDLLIGFLGPSPSQFSALISHKPVPRTEAPRFLTAQSVEAPALGAGGKRGTRGLRLPLVRSEDDLAPARLSFFLPLNT